MQTPLTKLQATAGSEGRDGAGLSSSEAAERLIQFGPNAIETPRTAPLLRLARRFWAPVPWMLEATIVLQLILQQGLTAAVVAALLVVNALLGFYQEERANGALELLKSRLALRCRVKRDGTWIEKSAADLVPGDLVDLSLGGVVPADIDLIDGDLLLDQSMLTGESAPVEASADQTVYAGALVRRGDAIGLVAATGQRTYFGRAAELVSTAHVEGLEQKSVLRIVEFLTFVNFVIAGGIVLYALFLKISYAQIALLVLTTLLSAVPVALPATFTLAAALGARTLAMKGVLLTRLSALQEAAAMDVLCVDKTGTLTMNQFAVGAVRSLDPRYSDADVIAYAVAASASSGQDPIDSAVRQRFAQEADCERRRFNVIRFTPFDPATKMSEAFVRIDQKEIRIVKGAPHAVAKAARLSQDAAGQVEALSRDGLRMIVVAAGPPDRMTAIGLIGFSDPPRPDSARLLAELRSLGVRPVMITGDSEETAASVAKQIGLDGSACAPEDLPPADRMDECAMFAGVFPEQKFKIVQALQRQGRSVGMCGDGANDAPALRQAQVGIAVSTATDVAKAAAAMVLTEPGLVGVLDCIKEGRSAFQRVLTYALMMLVNKCVTLVVLGFGLLITGHAVLTPLLQAIAMLTSDIITMARAADHARPTPYPNAWRVGNLAIAAVPLAAFRLIYLVAILAICWRLLGLDAAQMQTMTFLMLAYAGQGNLYALRERERLWRSRPANALMLASVADLLFVTAFALSGFVVASIPFEVVLLLASSTIAFTLILDSIKVTVLKRVRID